MQSLSLYSDGSPENQQHGMIAHARRNVLRIATRSAVRPKHQGSIKVENSLLVANDSDNRSCYFGSDEHAGLSERSVRPESAFDGTEQHLQRDMRKIVDGDGQHAKAKPYPC